MKNVVKTFFLTVITLLLLSIDGNKQVDTNSYYVTLNPEDIAPCGGTNDSFEKVFF